METKKCQRCQRIKPVDDFYRHSERGYQHWCKGCSREYGKENHQRTLDNARKRYPIRNASTRDKRKQARVELIQRLGGSCRFCSARENLQVDHIDEKNGASDRALGSDWYQRHLDSAPGVAEALLQPLCFPCHRLKTGVQAISPSPEVTDLLCKFVLLLLGPSGDGKTKREASLKPHWEQDDSHVAAAYRHLGYWEAGERKDKDSSCHPLSHASWRLLATAYRETHDKAVG